MMQGSPGLDGPSGIPGLPGKAGMEGSRVFVGVFSPVGGCRVCPVGPRGLPGPPASKL